MSIQAAVGSMSIPGMGCRAEIAIQAVVLRPPQGETIVRKQFRLAPDGQIPLEFRVFRKCPRKKFQGEPARIASATLRNARFPRYPAGPKKSAQGCRTGAGQIGRRLADGHQQAGSKQGTDLFWIDHEDFFRQGT
ncbi:hypothetical protein [Pararobbsia alpina]|uniref:hypothetical protein n=1 Tax=Pararobbsia alpina TaxID=621374 RepID=UPI001C2F0734|nr:hypothetical protein [Pararobbsia alpina]